MKHFWISLVIFIVLFTAGFGSALGRTSLRRSVGVNIYRTDDTQGSSAGSRRLMPVTDNPTTSDNNAFLIRWLLTEEVRRLHEELRKKDEEVSKICGM